MIAGDLLLASLAGAAVGSVAGLVPGVHPNAVAVLALGALGSLPGEAALPLVAGLVAMGMAHQLTALIPASFLGAPAEEDALRALPAQEMLRSGRAAEAVHLALRGSVLGAAVAMALVLPLHAILGSQGEGYRWIEPAIPLILAAIAALLLLTETAEISWRRVLRAEPFATRGQQEVCGVLVERRGTELRLGDGVGGWIDDPLGLHDEAQVGEQLRVRGRWTRTKGSGSAILGILAAATVFALAGFAGFVAQRLATPSPLGLPGSSMFPLLTGLFGVPSLLLALGSPKVPPQPEWPRADWPGDGRAAVAGASAGCLVGILPGMSTSAASVLALTAAPQRSREGTLVSLSAASASAAVVTALAYVLVQRARSGVMLAVQEVAPPEPWMGLAPPRLLAIIVLGCAAGLLVGWVATRLAGQLAARIIHRVPYARVSAVVLGLLVALVAAFTGPWGLALLAIAAMVGLLPWKWGLRKGHLMGCTMLPLILGPLSAGA
jgi:TctA family transporter